MSPQSEQSSSRLAVVRPSFRALQARAYAKSLQFGAVSFYFVAAIAVSLRTILEHPVSDTPVCLDDNSVRVHCAAPASRYIVRALNCWLLQEQMGPQQDYDPAFLPVHAVHCRCSLALPL